jgi:hypothetical protein
LDFGKDEKNGEKYAEKRRKALGITKGLPSFTSTSLVK